MTHYDHDQDNLAGVLPTDEAELSDSDLVEQFSRLSAEGRRRIGWGLRREQYTRNQERARRAAMTPVERRREDARKLVDGAIAADENHYIHSVLALCAMPYRRPPETQTDYVREFGRSSLVLQSGYLRDPHTGRMVKQGLPYGPKPRLLMVHLCSMALRNRSAEIEIDDSLSSFIRSLGFEVTGGERGTIKVFKEQLHRLAATRMQIGLFRGEVSSTINTQPFERIDLWTPQNPEQRMLWPTTVKLDERFYDSLKSHALPVDVRMLKAFSQSSRQMDIVMWLGYRLPSLREPLMIGWDKLQEQYGVDVHLARRFRKAFHEDWNKVLDVFGKLPARLDEKGLLLYPADPHTLLLPRRRIRTKP